MSETSRQLRKIADACRDWNVELRSAADEIERLQAKLDTAQSAAVNAISECSRLRAENERLQAFVDRMPTTADGVPIAQTSLEKVWRMRGPEGTPQMCEFFQNGFAVFRGATHNEMMRICDCYSTREAAEKARVK